jgi:hypothetical protein
MSQVTITNKQKVRANLAAKKADGTDASIHSSEWSVVSGDSTVVQIDAVTADLVSGEVLADTEYQVLITADFGGGLGSITVPFNFTMTVASIPLPSGASISVAFGIPQPK